MDFQSLLKNARQTTGESQPEFARRLGIPVRTLQSWEQGQRQPSATAARFILESLRCQHTKSLESVNT